jgi:dihydrofolate synthase/folylpolyglutamate synthase
MALATIKNPKSQIQNFAAAAAFIQSLDQIDTPQHTRNYHFTQGIARARHLLDRLGGAPNTTANCILVAGSKGKGSTTAMLASILAAAGYRVGAFTGPHLHSPLERFRNSLSQRERVGGRANLRLMPAPVFVDFARRIHKIVGSWDRADLGLPTRFEAFTAIAYRWFEEIGTDINVMEIGIGGRLDAVNLADPMLSVITNISLEHTQMLGNTLAKIAREKAGIMRTGRPVVIAAQTGEALASLCEAVIHIDARPILAESEWQCAHLRHEISPRRTGQWFASPSHFGATEFFLPLLGGYQLQNVAAVLAACSVLDQSGFTIDRSALHAGLAGTRWQGRFEVLQFKPLVIADGAHTPYSMVQLCASLRDYFPGQRIHFVVGILRDKDSRGMLEAIAHTATSVTLCDMPVRRAIPAEVLSQHWNELTIPRVTPTLAKNLNEAMARVLPTASADDVICIAGSLHLVAEAEEESKQVTE